MAIIIARKNIIADTPTILAIDVITVIMYYILHYFLPEHSMIAVAIIIMIIKIIRAMMLPISITPPLLILVVYIHAENIFKQDNKKPNASCYSKREFPAETKSNQPY